MAPKQLSAVSLATLLVVALEMLLCYGWQSDPNAFQLTTRMPDAVSDRTDALLCHAVKLDKREAYIVKYEPHASRTVAHHMMVYGCGAPGSRQPYWPCGEMDDQSDKSVCSDGERHIVYAWALDAASRDLPEGVGFRVGGTTGIDYIVIQLHYVDKFKRGQTDNSGVTLHMTYTPQPKQAGYYVLGNSGYIPAQNPGYHMESACEYSKPTTIYPIGYRTHSHNLGLVTSGYRIRDGVWTEIGRMSPQLPQTFYNVSNPGIAIQKGDILAARCTMNSMKRRHYTWIGPTNWDEMCNFYILYYTYNKDDIRVSYCFRDAQQFKWDTYLKDVPKDASSLDGLPNIEEIQAHFATNKGMSVASARATETM